MKDVQNAKDIRELDVDEVGISDFKIPLIAGCGQNKQQIIADTKMGVNLLSDFKGTHMSRFSEIANKIRGRYLDERLLSSVLKKIKEKFQSDYVKVEFFFIYFVGKKAGSYGILLD